MKMRKVEPWIVRQPIHEKDVLYDLVHVSYSPRDDAEWEKVSLAKGFAVYDPKIDRAVNDTVLRADAAMYANKREAKAKRTRG